MDEYKVKQPKKMLEFGGVTMLHFKANQKQRIALEGLAYWIADSAHLRQQYGNSDPEAQIAHSAIHSLFRQLDRLKVPYWVQNETICWAEDVRRYRDEYMQIALAARGIEF